METNDFALDEFMKKVEDHAGGPIDKKSFIGNVERMYFREGSYSYSTNRMWLHLSVLEEELDSFLQKVREILDPSKIFKRSDANSLIEFRKLARDAGVQQGVDEPVLALEKMGAFICSRTESLGPEVYIEIRLDGYSDDVAHDIRNAYVSFMEFIEESVHFTSYILTCVPDGSGRMKEVIFPDPEDYLSKSRYDGIEDD